MRSKSQLFLVYVVCLLAVSTTAFGAEDPALDVDAYNRCLLEKLRTAADDTPVSEIRASCLLAIQDSKADEPKKAPTTPLDARIEETKATEQMKFVITPYKPNYILVGYNANPNTAPYEEAFPDEDFEFKTAEVKFQISFMFPVVQNIFGNNGDLYFAYTNRSFWQLFNEDLSSPFRETNHEPEAWSQFDSQWKVLGLTNRLNSFGYVHQSNGRNRPLSRSWNRLFASFVFERGNFAFGIKPWIIIGDLEDNPDIRDYMGNFELRAAYKWNRHTLSLLSRNMLQSGFSKGAFQFDWSFPLYHRLRLYTQYFNGYGESLIDYDYFNNTLGVGLSFTDYF